MNKSFKNIGYAGLLLAVVSCAYSSDSEYNDDASGYYSDYIVSDFTLDDYEPEFRVHREHKKSRERALQKHSLALKKIVQKHNGSLSSPNANGGMGFERDDAGEKPFVFSTNQHELNRNSAIIAIPVIDYEDCFKRAQEKLKPLINSAFGAHAFQAKPIFADHLYLHCTLLYLDNYKLSERQRIHTAITNSLPILKGLTPLVADGPVQLFGTRGGLGRTFLGVAAKIDDRCINEFLNNIIAQLPADRQDDCRKYKGFHLSLGYVDINNDYDGQTLKDIIRCSNVQCEPYTHYTTRIQFRMPGVKDPSVFVFAPTYAERQAQPTETAAPIALNQAAPHADALRADALCADAPEQVVENAYWAEVFDRRSKNQDVSEVPENWEDISFED